jgi:hypothetical protein
MGPIDATSPQQRAHYFGDSPILRRCLEDGKILEMQFSKPELNLAHLRFIFH